MSKRKPIWCRVGTIAGPDGSIVAHTIGDDDIYAWVVSRDPNPRVARCIVASRLSAMLRAVNREPRWRRR